MDERVETGCCDVEDGVLQTEHQRYACSDSQDNGEMKEKLSMVLPK